MSPWLYQYGEKHKRGEQEGELVGSNAGGQFILIPPSAFPMFTPSYSPFFGGMLYPLYFIICSIVAYRFPSVKRAFKKTIDDI